MCEVIDLMQELWFVMSLKSKEIHENLIENEKYEKAEWLDGWITESRLVALTEFLKTNLSDIDEKGIAKLHKRIIRYINYFDLLDKEDDSKKYEYMFNYLTDIPSQIVHYISNYNNKEVR